jgi:deazaflavin-dependent oxidoreductase (nitroreductase family)
MAREFRYSFDRRIVNRVLVWMLKAGMGPQNYYLLTVQGRITGNPHSVPIALVDVGTTRWLVAPYGEVDWVKNARVANRVRLSRGKYSQDFTIRELPRERSLAILKQYLKSYPITRPYFTARADSESEEFAVDAEGKPVFELHPVDS